VGVSARGGLEPGFRVLFSAIFPGVSLENFHQGRNRWKWAEAKVWYFVAALHTSFYMYWSFSAFPRGYGESQYNAVLSQGIIYLGFRGRGPGQTLAAHEADAGQRVRW
jgi:hypothetical protein